MLEKMWSKESVGSANRKIIIYEKEIQPMKDENKKLNDTLEKEAEIADEMLAGVSGGVNLKPSVDLTGQKKPKSKSGKTLDLSKKLTVGDEKDGND